MIRSRHHAGFAALVVLALATTTFAQNQQGGRGFGGGAFGGVTETVLLAAPKVLEELKVTDEQKGKIETVLRDARPNFANFQNASEEERRKAGEEFAKKREEATKKVKEILSADQNKRLKELLIQFSGPEIVANPEVAAALKVTDDQKKQLMSIMEENRNKSRDIGFGEGSREKREELRKETETKVAGVLTADQKKQLEEMKGAKAPFDRTALFQGFGGGNRKKAN